MPELFDLIAGTETGAIIGGSLVIPSDTSPKTDEDDFVMFYANHSREFYENNVYKLFVS